MLVSFGDVKRVMAGGLSSQNPCCYVTWVHQSGYDLPSFLFPIKIRRVDWGGEEI
jgi:hypothetical protein